MKRLFACCGLGGRRVAKRFVDAQNGVSPVHQFDPYATAMTELVAGTKTSHWIWYVFPQIAGLGTSDTSKFYAIKDCCEAKKFLGHPILGPRYAESLEIVVGHVTRSSTGDVWQNLRDIFGNDRKKFRSSITLFDDVARKVGGPTASRVRASAGILWAAGLRPCNSSKGFC